MHNRISLVLIASLLLVSAPVLAKGKPSKETAASRESKEREARKACLEGDYAKGVAILSDLFLDSKDATYIFNQGRCYEQNERYEEAISRFREYLRTSTDEKELAQKHISECEALEQKKNPSAVAPVAQPVAAPPVAAPTPVAQPVASVPAAPIPAPSNDGSGLRTTGLVVGGVGVAALVAGVALNLKANSLADSITPPNTYQRSTESTRQGYETMSWVSYGVGAAALATGAVLYGMGWNRSSGNVAIAPILGPGMVGATAGRTF